MERKESAAVQEQGAPEKSEGSVAEAADRRSYKEGLLSAIGSNLWWGIMPIYWHFLRPIDSIVIIYYRVLLVAVVSAAIAVKKYGIRDIISIKNDKKSLAIFFVAGALITVNWSIYIWAVNADYVIQTCIGYYIEPLIICIIGILIFKEKLSKYKIVALSFAAVGVGIVIAYYKEIPLIAISVALSFAIYAAIKKSVTMAPIKSLLYETVFFAPIALCIIIYVEATGRGALAVGEPLKYFLLMFCGAFTALPLGLFANAAGKLNLFVVGLTNYISPTISLFIGIFLFNEDFDAVQLVSFAVIWVGLCFFSYGEYKTRIKESKS